MKQTLVGKPMFASFKSIMSNMVLTVIKKSFWLKLKVKFLERVTTLKKAMS